MNARMVAAVWPRKGVLPMAAVAVLFGMASVCDAAITHRYSFASDASDSVGTAHGTLENGATVSGGELILGGGAQHASLPGPTIGINGYSAATLELWLTSSTVNTNFTMAAVLGRTYDAGLGEPDWAGYQYIMVQPTRGSGPAASRTAITAERFETESGVNGPSQINDNVPHYLAVTVDAANISYYIDGSLIGSAAVGANTLSTLSNNLAYLGRSVYQFDPNFVGSIDEFRIYSSALDAATIARNAQLGPNVVPEPTGLLLLGLATTMFAVAGRRKRVS